jgi:uncharacterized protein YndB with AHSA1/START domain
VSDLQPDDEQREDLRDGAVNRDDDRWSMHFVRVLRYPPTRVWTALTDPAELENWLATTSINPVEGGDVELRWHNSDQVTKGTITDLIEHELLDVDTDTHGRLRWELHPALGGSQLRFTVWPPRLAESELLESLTGWHVHLDALADALDGNAVDWAKWPPDTFEDARQRYAGQGLFTPTEPSRDG